MNRRTLGCLFELIETFLITLVIILLVQLFVAQPFQVQNISMQGSLTPGQYVVLDKVTPHFDDLHRGDIVVFSLPSGSALEPAGTLHVARVVGQGGDAVDIHGGRVYINGSAVDESYLSKDQTTDMPDGGSKTWKLSASQVFVMGDNRRDQTSRDSRDFGPVEKSAVVGRVWLRYWPFDKFGVVSKSNTPAGSPSSSKAP